MADAVAEWLRRWTANPLGSAREGSNPSCVDIAFCQKLLNDCFTSVIRPTCFADNACHAFDRGSSPRRGEGNVFLLTNCSIDLQSLRTRLRQVFVGSVA